MRTRRSLLLALPLLLSASGAQAAVGCTSPSGTAGDQIYNSNYNVMQYCNGSNWINMGTAGGIGPLIAGDICTTDGTLVDCNTAALGLTQLANIAGLSVLGNAGSMAGNVAAISGTANQVLVVNSAGTSLGFGAVNLASGAAVTGLLPISSLNISGTGSGSTFLNGLGQWAVPTLSGSNVTLTVGSSAISGGSNQQILYDNNGVLGSANSFIWNNGSGFAGLGTATASAQLHIAGTTAILAPAWTTNGIGIRQDAQTYTDTSSSGTVASNYVNVFHQPTLSASSATAYTTAATLEIDNAPAAGGNVILTNPLSLYVASGSASFGGNVGIGTASPQAPLHVAGSTVIVGAGEGGTPSGSTIRGANAGGSNVPGGNLTIQAGNGTDVGGSGAILFLTAAARGTALDNASSTYALLVSSSTTSFAVGANSNRLLIVDTVTQSSAPVTAVTYGGVAMTQLYVNTVSAIQHAVYYLVAPATGANNLVVTFTSGTIAQIGISSFYNVSQLTPVGTVSSGSGSSGTSDTQTIASSTGAYGYDSLVNTAGCPAPGTGQSSLYSCVLYMGASYKPGAASVSMTETFASGTWDHVAFSINAASGTGPDSLATAVTIASTGNVGIGTTSPNTALHVNGVATLGVNGAATGRLALATGTASGQAVTLQNGGTTAAYTISLPVTAGTAAGQPLIWGSSGATSWGALSGNTGTFATTSGTLTSGDCVKLDANGNFVDAGAACGSGGGSGLTVGTTAIASGTNQEILFDDNGVLNDTTTMVWNKTSGFLGIGTNSPSFGIDVETPGANTYSFGKFGSMIPVYLYDATSGKGATSTSIYSGVGINLYETTSGTYVYGKGSSSSYGAAIDMAPGTGSILFKVTPSAGNAGATATTSTAMVIGANGNVGIGIGTASPSTALQVNGTVTATQFTGSGAGLGSATVPVAALTSSSTTVNGQTCSLGGNCTVPTAVAVLGGAVQLKIVNDGTTPNSVIDVSAAKALMTNSSNYGTAANNVSVTINLASSGANGLDTGSKAASTWYFLYLISNGSTTAGLASTSSTSPTLPGGYSYSVRVGAMETDGSGNLYRTLQNGREATYTRVATTNTANYPTVASAAPGATWTAIALGSYLPPTATKVSGIVLFALSSSSNLSVSPNNTQAAASGADAQPDGAVGFAAWTNYASAAAIPFTFQLESSNIYYCGNVTSSNGKIEFTGWTDNVNAN